MFHISQSIICIFKTKQLISPTGFNTVVTVRICVWLKSWLCGNSFLLYFPSSSVSTSNQVSSGYSKEGIKKEVTIQSIEKPISPVCFSSNRILKLKLKVYSSLFSYQYNSVTWLYLYSGFYWHLKPHSDTYCCHNQQLISIWLDCFCHNLMQSFLWDVDWVSITTDEQTIWLYVRFDYLCQIDKILYTNQVLKQPIRSITCYTLSRHYVTASYSSKMRQNFCSTGWK